MTLVNGSILHYTDMKKFLKISSTKLQVRIWNNFTRLFLVCPFLKIVLAIVIRRKIWPPWRGGFLHWTLKKFHRNVPLVTLFKNRSRNFDLSINMATCTLLTYRNSCKFFPERDKRNWLWSSQKFR